MIEYEHEVVGSIFLGVDAENGSAQLACLIDPARWRTGIGHEAATAVIAHGFRDQRLARIWARAEAENVASVRTMESLGMVREGLLRSHRATRGGGRADEVVYGLLREEWRGR